MTEHRHEYCAACEHHDDLVGKLDGVLMRLDTLEILAGMNVQLEIEAQDKIEDLEDAVEDLEEAVEDEAEDDGGDGDDHEDNTTEEVPVEEEGESHEEHHEEHHESDTTTPSRGMAFGRRR